MKQLSAVLTEAKKHCEEKNLYDQFKIIFTSDEIVLKIDKSTAEWKITSKHPPLVSKEDVDKYNGSVYPPHGVFIVTWTGEAERDPNDVMTLQLVGAKPPKDCCNIELQDISMNTQSTQAAKKYGVTDQQLDTMITDEHINKVSRLIEHWEQVANQLRVDRLQIADIQQSPGINLGTKNHRVLTAWRNAEYREATYRKLVEALDKLKEVKCADEVCGLFRNTS